MGISKTVYEDPRLDFNNYAPLDPAAEEKILAAIDALAPEIDALCVSDQLQYGAVTPKVRERLGKLAREGLTVVVDSRDRIGFYESVILKPNEIEGAAAAGYTGARSPKNLGDFAEAASALSKKQNSEVLMTIGAEGSLYAKGENVTHIPAHDIAGEIDIVGAGDSFLAGLSLALAAGASRPEAAGFATLCSEVAIRQIGVTGVARPEDIISWQDKTLNI
jgi:bifunctional ADP-heptose synthase (sugar kinase/adenylyltransferase)